MWNFGYKINLSTNNAGRETIAALHAVMRVTPSSPLIRNLIHAQAAVMQACHSQKRVAPLHTAVSKAVVEMVARRRT